MPIIDVGTTKVPVSEKPCLDSGSRKEWSR
jgi:hypothetical protein